MPSVLPSLILSGSGVHSSAYMAAFRLSVHLQVDNIMERVRADFPGAEVVPSSFDAFTRPLTRAVREGLELPVLTDEIGDTCASLVEQKTGCCLACLRCAPLKSAGTWRR